MPSNDPNLIAPAYSSLPGARASLYLDFNGHFDATWGSYSNVDTPAYSTDSDITTWTASELDNIYRIWQAVAEDYAPFNINVTTVEPSSFANGVSQRVAIGGNGSWTGGTYGGISYVGSFTNSQVNTSYVFPANLGNGFPKYVADASSHEAGHSFGLQHQQAWSGNTLSSEYYGGPGDGTAPLMGGSYSAARSLWWYGTSGSGTSYQNDMNVIGSMTNGFGYRTDDNGNTIDTSSALAVDGAGTVSGSGLISTMSDVDYFSFTTDAGSITLSVGVTTYSDLDARLSLYDAAGNLVASADPDTSSGATITFDAAAGTYYLAVASHGMSASATANNYGFNVGQYTLSGSIVSTGASGPNAPTSLTATSVSTSQINLNWIDNSSDETGFKIERLVNSVWTQVATVGANVTTWQDSGLTAATSYTYRVRAYSTIDSAYSNTATATTDSPPPVSPPPPTSPPPPVSPPTSAPGAPTNLTATARQKPLSVRLAWRDNATNETGYIVQRSTDGGTTWTQIASLAANSTNYTDKAVTSGTTYYYRVRAVNGSGSSDYSNVASAPLGGLAFDGSGTSVEKPDVPTVPPRPVSPPHPVQVISHTWTVIEKVRPPESITITQEPDFLELVLL